MEICMYLVGGRGKCLTTFPYIYATFLCINILLYYKLGRIILLFSRPAVPNSWAASSMVLA